MCASGTILPIGYFSLPPFYVVWFCHFLLWIGVMCASGTILPIGYFSLPPFYVVWFCHFLLWIGVLCASGTVLTICYKLTSEINLNEGSAAKLK
jgi:hypothetical protein